MLVFLGSAAGDYDGDGLENFVSQHGQNLEMVLGPGLFESFFDEVGSADDLATYPAASAELPDALVVVNAGGLSLISELTSVPPTVTPLGTHPGWAGATRVAVRWLAGESSPRIFGVMSDGRTLRTLLGSGSGYTDLPLAVASGTVVDIAFVNLEGDSKPELVAMSTELLEVFNTDGSPFGSYDPQWNVTGRSITVGRQLQGGPEWIAWLADYIGLPQQFVGTIEQVPGSGLSLTSLLYISLDPEVVGYCTGDVEGDGDTDFLMSYKLDHTVPLIYNLGNPALPAFNMNGPGLRRRYEITDLFRRPSPSVAALRFLGNQPGCLRHRALPQTTMPHRNAPLIS